MKPPFSVLVVYGDGSRVLRLSLPRPIAYGALGLAAAVALANLSLIEGQRGRMAALGQRVRAQREVIGSFDTRVAAVRGEILTWKALHAKMWKAFGSEADAGEAETGVGGGGDDDYAASGEEPGPGRQLSLLTTSVAEEGPRLRELERVVTRSGKIVSALPLRWPVHGQIKSGYGLRPSPWTGALERHHGVDIGGPPGTPVLAPAAGTVVDVGSRGGFGKHIVLDHGHSIKSRYAHLQKLDVTVGQQVEKGQMLGRVGSTGRSTGPHLHYEVLMEGKPVDPSKLLWDR